MANKISVFSILIACIFIGCAKSNPSGALKRALKKDGGEWEVTHVDEYYTNLHYPEFEFSKNLGVTGTYYFDDVGDPHIAGDFGTWTPINGEKRDLIYQIADTQNKLTATIWFWENNETTDHEGYMVYDDWSKSELVWENSTTTNDTIIVHIKTLRKLVN